MMKTIGIAGGSGFIGKYLAAALAAAEYNVIIFSRGKVRQEGPIRYANWNPDKRQIDTEALKETDAMINLAGAGVTAHRWTEAYRKEIIESRVGSTEFLIEQLRLHSPNCKTYIASSATGIYGPDRAGSSPFTEAAPPYPDFLGEVCRLWEAASLKASDTYRTIIFRLGIVLGKEGGAYPELSGPMKLGVMPVLGSGRQMVSWIHVEDAVRMILFALKNEQLSGSYNCVSPQPVTHKAMMRSIAASTGGWKIPVPVPALGLKLLMGASSIEVLKSCTASADKILGTGFSFNYNSIDEAVENLAS